MKKNKFIIISSTIFFGIVNANYTMKIPLQNEKHVNFYNWITTDSSFGEWENTGNIYSCSNWLPSSSDITVGQSFTQTATDCKQNQIRTVQNRQIDEVSGNIRNIGELYAETQVITVSSTQEAVGSKESWVATTPTYTAWTNNGAVTGCSNWYPAPATVTIGQYFTQTATDCQQPQTRSRQDREQETTTLAYRNKGSAVTESQSITVSSSRSATGTKESWVATSPTYTAWVNSGAITGCTNWSPATSTVNKGQTFTQTATDCKQVQVRSRQDREQETTTKEIRNKGQAVTESQSITVSSTRSAVGTKVTRECFYSPNNTMASKLGSGYTFWFNTASLGYGEPTLSKGGYTYSAGAYKETYNGWLVEQWYEICRTPN